MQKYTSVPGDGPLAGFFGKISVLYTVINKLDNIILGGKIWIK